MSIAAPRRAFSALIAFVTVIVLAIAGSVISSPAVAAERSITDAVFRWGINTESNAAAFAPGTINHLAAGVIGMTSATDRVTATNWKQSEGNVSIEKRQSDGTTAAATFAGLRTTASGTTITTGNGLGSGHEVVISDGVGQVDVAAGTASIQWTGTFTVVYYSGMTRFWVQDPRLDIAADGTGTVTATLGGWGTSMENPELFTVVDPVPGIVIADLSGVQVGADGIVVTPDYAGVEITSPRDAVQQVRNASFGSFPQSFVDFQLLTGQHAYWFSSGGAADARKTPSPISIAYSAPAVAAPVITTQPSAVTVEAGQDAVFTVAADTAEPASIRWERSADGESWTVVDGATSAELRFAATTADDAASFRAVVTNSGGSTTSDAARLTVTPVSTGTVTVTGAQFEWAYSGYAQEGVFGKWRQWTEGEGVSLTTLDGRAVSGAAADEGRDFTAVRFDGGTGTIDAETGAGTITWPNAGSWKLNAYPAMYGAPDETLSEPILTIAPDGSGTLSFAAYLPAHNDVMYGTGMQPAVGPDRKVLATFSSVTVDDGVITVVPDFAGRAYATGPDVSPWLTCEGVGGSWPAEWIDFLPVSVRAHYYTTSCSGLNLTKPPFTFTVDTLVSAPAIVEQPTATHTRLAASSSLGLSVVATGNPISYQWQRSVAGGAWIDVPGETDAVYTAEAAASDDQASFRVVVGSGSGAVVSDAAGPFTVTTAPIVVTTQPSDSIAGLGGTISFVGIATGSPRPTATWEHSTDGATWTPVAAEDFIDRSAPGSTTSDSTTLIMVADESDGGQYRVTWTNGVSTVVSNVVAGTVLNEVPTVRGAPTDIIAVAGVDARFSGSFNGLPAATLQWQVSTDGGATWADWTASESTSNTLVVPSPGTELSGALFRLRGTAPAGTTYTEPVSLTVFPRTGEQRIDARVVLGELGVSSARVSVAGQGFDVPAAGLSAALRVGLVTKAAWDNGSYAVSANHLVTATVQRSTILTNGGAFVSNLTVPPARIENGVEYGIVVISADEADRRFDEWVPLITNDTEPTEITGAQLQWTYSGYAQAGVFGPWRQWTTGTGVNVVSVDGQTGSGQAADAGKPFTGARFDGGSGTLDPVTGAGTITWPNTGAWVINAYPTSIGAPDETLAAPILKIAADGSGTLSFDATLPAHTDVMGGGGWVEQVGPERTVVATFSSVTVGDDGAITVVPDYAGRSYDPGETGSPWASCDGIGGAWPTEWIDFVSSSVRAHYYTTSCAGLNLTKGPHPFTVTTAPAPLAITKQQGDVIANASRPVTLAVGADGNPMPVTTWQQRIDGEWVTDAAITGLTPTFTAEPRHAGTWRPVFTVGSDAVTGDEFDIAVNSAAPTFETAPTANYTEVGDGEQVVITSVVAGFPTPSVTWERSTDGGTTWSPITEGVEYFPSGDVALASLRFTATAGDNGALYRETASNGVGADLVGTVGPLVIRAEPIAITAQPISYIAPERPVSGSAAIVLTVEATGFPIRDDSYQWQKLDEATGEWTNLTNTRATYTAQLSAGTASYRVVVGAGSAKVTSDVSRIVVIPGQAGRIISVGSPSVAVGEIVTFAPSFNTPGDPTPALQWQRSNDAGASWQNLSGETAATLSFTAAAADNGAQFRILVDNGVPAAAVAGIADVSQIPGGTAVTSATGTLTVLVDAAPSITTDPSDTVSFVGQNATFSAVFDAYPVPAVRWSTSVDDGATWQEVAGAAGEGTTLTISAPTLAQSGLLARATATNSLGTVTTRVASLSVVEATAERDLHVIPTGPIVASEPTTLTIIGTGYSWTSSVAAAARILRVGVMDASVWQPGATSPGAMGFVVSGAASAASLAGGTFRVTVTVPAGRLVPGAQYGIATLSNTASARHYDGWKALEVATAPTVTVSASATTVLVDGNAALTADADGSPEPTLQWQHAVLGGDFADIVGATGGVLELTGLDATAQYRVVATNVAGSIASEALTVTVLPVPRVTVSKTAGLDADGEKVVVRGSGFLPFAPATSATQPPLHDPESTNATPFGGVQIAFARIGNDWKPSLQGTELSVIESVWAVHEGDLATIGGAGIGRAVIAADGTFEVELTVKTGALDATGQYAVVTYAGGGAVHAPFETATPVALVEAAPVITSQPSPVIAPIEPAIGSAVATFSVAATGEPTPSIQWERREAGGSWRAIDGAATATLELPYTATDAGLEVRAVATNALGSTASDAASLTLGDRPAVEPLAEQTTVVQGDDLVIAATLTGTGAVISWQVRDGGAGAWHTIEGADDATLTVDAAAVRHGQQYRIVVSSPIPATPGGAPETVESLPTQVSLREPADAPADVEDAALVDGAELELLSFDGTTARVDVGGAHTARHVGAWLHSDPIALGWTLVEAEGIATVTLPADVPAGAHRLVLVDDAGALIGWAAVTVAAAPGEGSATPTPTPTPVPGALPATGADVLPGLILGILLLLAGSLAFGTRRAIRRS